MDIRTKEAIRYLGYRKCAIDEKTLQLIHESFRELEQIAEKKFVYRIFEVVCTEDKKVQIGDLCVESRSLYRNLEGCKKAVIFAASLGIEVDRYIRKNECIDMAKAVVLQACAAALLEEYCDDKQEKLAYCYMRPRFSPGYGDFSILHQKDVLSVLNATKEIGLALTDGYMLTPTKSVTAVIGIRETKEERSDVVR